MVKIPRWYLPQILICQVLAKWPLCDYHLVATDSLWGENPWWGVDGIINNDCHPFQLSGHAASRSRPEKARKTQTYARTRWQWLMTLLPSAYRCTGKDQHTHTQTYTVHAHTNNWKPKRYIKKHPEGICLSYFSRRLNVSHLIAAKTNLRHN